VDAATLAFLFAGARRCGRRPLLRFWLLDARLPLELIFNEGPNDLFVVRVAGNTLGDDILSSLNMPQIILAKV
jgi:carbonic anhydrase